MSKYNYTQIKVNGKDLSVPREFFDVSVKATFGENVQANITSDEFTFVLSAYQEIINWINAGKQSGVGIFEGIPITIAAQGRSQTIQVLNGIIDLQDNAIISPQLGQVEAKIRKDDGLNQLSELLEPLDYGYLKELGVITASDYVNVDYVIVKRDIAVEAVTLFITAYLLQKQLRDSIKEIATTIGTIAGIASSAITGSVGATVFAIASALAQAIYAAALLVILIELGRSLVELFVPKKRTHKAILLKTMLEKACNYLGFDFNTTITDLNNIVYLPSNLTPDDREGTVFIKKVGTIKEGIPNATDYGYTCTEAFQLARDLFNGRFVVNRGVVQFHSENSDFWIKESTWIKPDARADFASTSFRYNTDELFSSIKIAFSTDLSDEYTIENFKGTNYQILTDAKTIQLQKNKTIKGLDLVNLPVALGNRKDSLTGFEKLLAEVAKIFDELSKVFGGNSNLSNQIKNKIGVLKVSSNNHSIPKLLWLEGTKLPKNHRDLLSAKVLWNKYHNEKSFISNNYKRQRVYYEGEKIPFGFDDFVKIIDNSYFKDLNGKLGKIVDLEWSMNRDYAIISYWQEEIYTKNLKETFIEP